jgi:sulfate-transporting ATPase
MAAAIAPEDVPRTTLTVTGLSVQFGGNRVLDGVDLELNSGEVLGVIGANGAGKSTLVDAITGFAPVVAGHVMLGDTELTSLTPARRARAGVTRSFQSLELFEDLTVEDNLLVAAGRPRGHEFVTAPVVARRHTLDTRTMAALAGLGLLEQRDAMPSTLSYGERRLLAIARALAARPQVLLLDEPAAGLGAEERQELADLITVIAREWQIAILVIEHDVDLVLGVSDSVVALDFGRVIARGVPDEIRRDPAVIRAYLGSDDSSGPTTPSDLSRTDGALA